MIKAIYADKKHIVNMLVKAFDTNQSINYIIPQDAKRTKRIRGMMEYSFDMCDAFGEVWLSDDRKACALVLFPDKKKTTLKSLSWDVKFATQIVGLGNVKKVLDREAKKD
jgi:hypothetical protein